MSNIRLLEGDVENAQETQIRDLEDEITDLKGQLRRANETASHAQREATRALTRLRKQLSPLYGALKEVFGELDAAGVEESADPVSAAVNRTSPVWASWKQRLSPSAGRVIDALMIHRELSIQQICVAATMGKNTVYSCITELKKAGVLDKNGGRFSLKQL